jgi:transcriptional regulator with XRE-family HTH domain
MLSSQVMVERIDNLAHARGMSRNQFLQQCGAKSYVDSLLKGQLPNLNTVCKISVYYGISLDYLSGMTDNPSVASSLFDAFIALPVDERKAFIQEAIKHL